MQTGSVEDLNPREAVKINLEKPGKSRKILEKPEMDSENLE